MRTIKLSTAAIGLAAFVSMAHAASPPPSVTMIPPQINYQGRLVTTTNTPYADATHVIDLSLYPSASGGAKIWSERYSVVTRDGYFSVNLGSGGTPLLPTNSAIWQVLWNGSSGGAETNNFFMSLTVRTDQNGANIASPVEATPRQQFLTAPFAYRAHQSVFARKADTVFDAPFGVSTTSLSSSNNQVDVNANLKVSGTMYGNLLTAQGASPQLSLLSAGGPMKIGMATTTIFGGGQITTEAASSIQIGAQSSLNGAGSDIYIDGRSIDLGTTNLTVNNLPMFVHKSIVTSLNTSQLYTDVAHGINTSSYDVVVVGHYQNTGSILRGVYIQPGWNFARVTFTATPPIGSVWVYFLGIRKGLTQYQ